MSEYLTHPESERSIHPVSIIRDVDHPAIRSTEKAVLWALASQLNLPKGRDTVYSSMATIAKHAGLEESGARRVMNWLVQVGIVLEVEGPYRAKSRQIDLARLVSLPTDLRRSRVDVVLPALDSVQGTLDVVTPSEATAPMDDVHPPLDSVPPTLDDVHPVRDVVQPKNDSKNKTRTIRRTISATVPARGLAPIGSVLVLNFGQSDPPTPVTITATPAARPETSKASVESLPVDDSNPPPKGKGKASKRVASKPTVSRARELTPEQANTQRRVSDFFYAEFENARGERPVLDWKGRDRVTLNQFLEKLDWNGDRACEIIANAFRQKTFVEYKCKLSELLVNTTQYQGTPTATRPSLSTSQMPTGKKDYGC